jgi:hypothetical protein
MKSTFAALFLIVAFCSAQSPQSPVSARGADEATALRVAERALIKVYGKRKIDEERPLTAVLEDGVWNVFGTLWCKDQSGKRTREPVCVGGVAKARVRKSDGKVLSVSHTM